MTHVMEHASSGRAKCRGCDAKIGKGELRFGEKRPNAFGDGEMILWFHPVCAAYKRPEPYLEFLNQLGNVEVIVDISADELSEARNLQAAAQFGIDHRRTPRIDKVDRAPTGRARCRSCREMIGKDDWRVGLVFFEEYRFQPSGFIHLSCAQTYFETNDVMDQIRHFSPTLVSNELKEIELQLKEPA